MGIFIFLAALFILLVFGGRALGRGAGNLMFPDRDTFGRGTYIDKSVHHHHHYHDNRSIHVDGEEFKKLQK